MKPWKVGLVKDLSDGADLSTLSSDPSDKREETFCLSPPPTLLLFRFFLLFNLPPTHPSGAETHAPMSLSLSLSLRSICNHHHYLQHKDINNSRERDKKERGR